MPYKFGEYVSTYVDPQSVRISEALRGRFMENFKAQDQLSMAVDQMKAALPFEKDVEKKKLLQQEIDDKLTILSQRGDYENLGFPVHNLAKDFTERYNPIKENYDRYQTALNDLSEQYKKGDINSEDYSYATSYITKGYKGFEVDPTTGKAKEGTMFSAPTIYKDPKLMDKIKERLEILYEKTISQKNGTVGMDANGVWSIRSGSSVTQIPETDVMDVYNQVIQEPDVEMYLNQRADMKTYAANQSGVTNNILQDKISNNNEAIKQLNDAINSGKYSAADNKTMATQLNALTEENTNLGKALTDPKLADNYVSSMFREDILAPVKAYALKKAGVRKQETERFYENDYAFFKQNRQWAHEAEMLRQEAIYSQDEVTAQEDVSGKTTDEKNQYIKDAQVSIEALRKEAGGNITDERKAQINAQIAEYQSEINRVYGQIKTAADKSISMGDLDKIDKTTFDVLREMYPQASSGELYLLSQRTFDRPGEQDYMDFVAAFDNKYGSGEFDRYSTGSKFYKTSSSSKIQEELEAAKANANKSAGYEKYKMGSEYFGFSEFMSGRLNEQVDNTFKEMKTSYLYTNYLETGDANRNKQLQNGLNEHFKPGTAPRQQENYILPDGTTKTGGELAADGYKFQNWGYNTEMNDYKITLVKSGEEGGVITAHLDGKQLTSQSLRAMQQDPAVVLGGKIRAHDMRDNGATSTIPDATIGGEPVNIVVTSTGGGDNPYISFTYKDGSPYFPNDKPGLVKMKIDDAYIQTMINTGLLKFGNPE